MGHGILDSVVAIESGKAVFHALNDLDYHVEWHDYLMEHSVCMEEIGHLSTFINADFQVVVIREQEPLSLFDNRHKKRVCRNRHTLFP